jgi:hypothetical protein
VSGALVGVGVRTVTLGGLPLLVAAVPSDGPGGQLLDHVADRGLVALPGVTGVELPRGARLGFVVDRSELRLVDEQDATLLRAPRDGLDPAWLQAALRLKGTMTVLGRDVEVDADLAVGELVGRLDAAAAEGRVLGAIVGLLEERPTLPLFL